MQKSIVAMSMAATLLACAMLVLAAEDATTEAAATKAAKVAPDPAEPTGVAPSSISDSALQNAIKDRRYLMHQIKCTLGEGPCDSVGRKLKALAPLVMKNICYQCTPTEKRQIQMVASHIQRTFPKEWSKIVRQYGST